MRKGHEPVSEARTGEETKRIGKATKRTEKATKRTGKGRKRDKGPGTLHVVDRASITSGVPVCDQVFARVQSDSVTGEMGSTGDKIVAFESANVQEVPHQRIPWARETIPGYGG